MRMGFPWMRASARFCEESQHARGDGFLGPFAAQALIAAQALARLEDVLLSSLPWQIARLKHSLEATLFNIDELPPRLVSRLTLPDGRARVQTFPRENLEDHAAFERFVDAVQGRLKPVKPKPVASGAKRRGVRVR